MEKMTKMARLSLFVGLVVLSVGVAVAAITTTIPGKFYISCPVGTAGQRELKAGPYDTSLACNRDMRPLKLTSPCQCIKQ